MDNMDEFRFEFSPKLSFPAQKVGEKLEEKLKAWAGEIHEAAVGELGEGAIDDLMLRMVAQPLGLIKVEIHILLDDEESRANRAELASRVGNKNALLKRALELKCKMEEALERGEKMEQFDKELKKLLEIHAAEKELMEFSKALMAFPTQKAKILLELKKKDPEDFAKRVQMMKDGSAPEGWDQQVLNVMEKMESDESRGKESWQGGGGYDA